MLSNEKKEEVLSKIKIIENFIISHGDGDIAIGTMCSAITAESAELAYSDDSLMPILRTALVINWRESAMKRRYDRFKNIFPKISTLSALKRIMDSTEPLDFCKTYLDINAKTDKNPKYCLLRELTNGFLEYQKHFGLSSEIEALRHWSKQVDSSDLKNDPIGKRHGVGQATVENIKLNLGCRVVKADRHVIGVMKKFLQVDIPVDGYTDFAKFIGKDARYLDCILFKYGKINNMFAKKTKNK